VPGSLTAAAVGEDKEGSARVSDHLFRRTVVINESRKWATALAIVASMALPANAPAFADDKPSGCKPTPEKVEVDTTSPINIGVLASALVYYRCTDYDDQVKAVLNEAGAWVAARAPGVDKPAIVLDIDETSLSNWEQIYHNKFGYVPSGSCDLKAQSAGGQRVGAERASVRDSADTRAFQPCAKAEGQER
jgi:hypothetical protein